MEFFKSLRDNRKTMGGMFGKVDKENMDGLVASYNISLLIGKTGKPQTIGEKLILPAMQEVVTTVLHVNARSIIQSIPLSNDTVAGRIIMMATDVENSLCDILTTTHDRASFQYCFRRFRVYFVS